MKEFKKFNGTSWQTVQPKKYDLKELSGTPPFSFESDGGVLQDWNIAGQTVQASTPTPSSPVDVNGVGERTGNLFNAATVTNERITWATGATFSADDYRLSDYIPVETTQTYTCSTSVWFVGYDVNKTYLGTYNDGAWDKNGLKSDTQFVNSATLGAAYIRILKKTTIVSTIMLNVGDTALQYEPFGYKIPVVNVQSGNLLDFNALKNAPAGTITNYSFPHVLELQLKPNTAYTMISNGTGNETATPADAYRSVYFNSSQTSSTVFTNHPVTVTTDSTGVVKIGIFTERTNAQQYLDGTAQVWLVEGSTVLPYQPYSNTTTNIYLGTSSSTRRVKKLVLTGNESVTYSKVSGLSRFQISSLYTTADYTIGYCTHYNYTYQNADGNIYHISSPNNSSVFVFDNRYTTGAAIKQYFSDQYAAGTPVTIWYVLATPETAAVNEPLMKIGSYADEINLTNSSVNISTVEGSNTLMVNTTIQPSSMSIKKGLWENCSLYEYTPNISGVPPFTFKSDGENLRDWSMSGQTVQASTPTPSSPVNPSGCGEKTGNSFNVSDYSVGETSFITKQITLEPNTTYTMSSNCPLYNGGALIVIGNIGESFSTASNGVYPNHSITRTADANGILVIGLRTNGSDYTPADYETMLNAGSTALPYEPYGYKIPVNVQSGNLFDADTVYSAYKQIDDTFQGTVNNFYTTHPTPFTASDIGKTFTFSIKVNATTSGNVRASANVGGVSINGNNLSSPGTTKVTFTVASTNDYLYLGYGSGGGNQITLSEIMLNRGSTPLPYQPYSNATTNIYLGSVVSTRRIKKLVLTGEETVQSVTESTLESGAYCFACLYSDLGMTDIIDYDVDMRDIPYPYYISDHFKMRATPTQQIVPYTDLYAGEIGANARKGGGASNRTFNRYIIFCVSGISTVADFKTYLAQQYANGTPITVWYVLAEPETAVINEPLMKIGSYADEITKTGTSVSIPTVNGSNTLAVNTTIQPSDMTIQSISQWVKQN